MKKHKIHIEKELNCKSANIIWPLLSSSGGLAKWFADYVERNDDQLTFTWGEPWTHQETRSATITEEVVAHHLKLAWHEEEDPDIRAAFYRMVETFATGKTERPIELAVLRLSSLADSGPDPESFLAGEKFPKPECTSRKSRPPALTAAYSGASRT